MRAKRQRSARRCTPESADELAAASLAATAAAAEEAVVAATETVVECTRGLDLANSAAAAAVVDAAVLPAELRTANAAAAAAVIQPVTVLEALPTARRRARSHTFAHVCGGGTAWSSLSRAVELWEVAARASPAGLGVLLVQVPALGGAVVAAVSDDAPAATRARSRRAMSLRSSSSRPAPPAR